MCTETLVKSIFSTINLELCDTTKEQLTQLGIDEIQHLYFILNLIRALDQEKPNFMQGNRSDLSQTLQEGVKKIKLAYRENRDGFGCKVNGGEEIFHIPKNWFIANLKAMKYKLGEDLINTHKSEVNEYIDTQ